MLTSIILREVIPQVIICRFCIIQRNIIWIIKGSLSNARGRCCPIQNFCSFKKKVLLLDDIPLAIGQVIINNSIRHHRG
uniref:Uncharacterized protein MANES_13G130700 n=1 Tax=Rhizophora mucronata TaxID=61149 RepID=A0A2P2IML4_RHIMU